MLMRSQGSLPAVKHLQQVAVVLVLLMVAGCATPETAVKQRQAVVTEEGLPLKAGFVHTEKVHASGGPFSTEALYWDHFFPQAAPAFAESRRYDSMDAALSSDVDVVVEGKSLVYGSPERFKYALSVRVAEEEHRRPGQGAPTSHCPGGRGSRVCQHGSAGPAGPARIRATEPVRANRGGRYEVTRPMRGLRRCRRLASTGLRPGPGAGVPGLTGQG